MPLKFLIYGLVDPKTRHLRYIGKSMTGLQRPRSHRFPSQLAKDHTHKANWIRKLQAQGLAYQIVIIQEFEEPSILAEAEVGWIAYFRGMGCPLTNLTDGGEGAPGWKPSKEQRAKSSRAHRPVRSAKKPDHFVCSKCNQELHRSRFDEWSSKRRRPVYPQCRKCRSKAYLKSKYPEPCPKCREHRPQNRNGVCAKCNEARGLRECRGDCCALLPIAVCFYTNKARCKDCLRHDKARRRNLSRASRPASKV